MARGLFITLEGIDFCGKTTQAELLRTRLAKSGVDVVLLRDPGGTRISEEIRAILLNPEHNEMHPVTELLLYEAARSQMVAERIRPALEAGQVVICDRFYDSTTAYQGYARGIPLPEVELANRLGSHGLAPDVTFVIDIPVEESLRREKNLAGSADRMESERPEFRSKVREGYLRLAEQEPGRVVVVDGTESVDRVHALIWEIVEREAIGRGIL